MILFLTIYFSGLIFTLFAAPLYAKYVLGDTLENEPDEIYDESMSYEETFMITSIFWPFLWILLIVQGLKLQGFDRVVDFYGKYIEWVKGK